MDSSPLYKGLLLALAALPFGAYAQPPPAEPKDWETSPPIEHLFEQEMPIPPIKEGKVIDGVTYYEFVVNQFTSQIYQDGHGPTTFVGYDGTAPGPTIKQKKGVNSVMRVINNWTAPINTHLHGSYSRAPFDGWAEDLIAPNQFKDYYYPNGQTGRTLWYHDHANDHTAEHTYFGGFGQYHIVDEELEKSLNLPCDKYDVPINIASVQFNKDGSLWSPDANRERISVYGDVILVNGVAWPKMTVEPRKYRFRFLDAAVSRSFYLYLEESGVTGAQTHYKSRRPKGGVTPSTKGLPAKDKRIPMTVVASDSGFLTKPIEVTDLWLSMAERYEVVIDFSKHKGKKLTLKNVRGFDVDRDYKHTDKIMQFHVKGGSCKDNSQVPSTLVDVAYPKASAQAERKFVFNGAPGVGWTINGVRFNQIENRILAKPERGSVERWTLINNQTLTSHPVHLHLVDMHVISRSGGKRGVNVLEYEAAGLKDTVWLAGGETAVVEAVYAPWEGVYMFHCHNLIHEDHAMMAAFNVSLLEDFGYEEKTHFVDPLDAAYLAKPCDLGQYSSRQGVFSDSEITKVIKGFEETEAYKDIDGVNAALDDYWSGRNSKMDALRARARNISVRGRGV